MEKRDWIVVGDGTNPKYPWGLHCLRCGVHERFPEILSVDDCLGRIKRFSGQHDKCGEQMASALEA